MISADGCWMSFIEFFDQIFCVDILSWFPAIMRFRESFPPDKVLELIHSLSYSQDSFYFPFGLSVDKLWGGFLILFPI
jgi:hypothetical protein